MILLIIIWMAFLCFVLFFCRWCNAIHQPIITECIIMLNIKNKVIIFGLSSLFLAPDFVPSLRRLFRNSIYTLMIITHLVAVNGFIGLITFKPKFLEQIYGQSASRATFIIGNGPIHSALPVLWGKKALKQWCCWREVWLWEIKLTWNVSSTQPSVDFVLECPSKSFSLQSWISSLWLFTSSSQTGV